MAISRLGYGCLNKVEFFRGSSHLFSACSAGHHAISTGQAKPGWGGYWLNFNPSILMTMA